MEYTRAILVAGGPLDRVAAVRLWADVQQPGALCVGVDGGANHYCTLGLTPDIVTGDFDSLTADELAVLESRGAQILPTPDQDFTDLDKALTYVREACGLRNIRVYGAVGGRLDHTYSVLSALVKHGASGDDIRLIDGVGETRPVNQSLTLDEEGLTGRVLSLMALGEVQGITTTGVRWPLRGETLAPGVRDGTLNEIVAAPVTIQVAGSGAGLLLVQIHHTPAPPRRTAF